MTDEATCRMIVIEKRAVQGYMPSLNHPRHEQFARLIVSGHSPSEAYAAVGYEQKAAYTCGPRLFRKAEVKARVTELQQTVSQVTATRSMIDREWVLSGLRKIAESAVNESTRVRAFELCGKELGMFQERPRHFIDEWDGDLSKLTDQQLARIEEHFLRLACGDDEVAKAELRRLALGPGTVVLDAMSEPVDSLAKTSERP